MSTLTPSVVRFPSAHRPLLTTFMFAIAFWAIAAGVVAATDFAVLKIAAVVAVAWLYVRLIARDCTVDHALFVGVAWLLLAIAAEVTASAHFGRGWFALIGQPAHPAIRDVLLFTWVAAPALFARCVGRPSDES